jgi:hypothetical protein
MWMWSIHVRLERSIIWHTITPFLIYTLEHLQWDNLHQPK